MMATKEMRVCDAYGTVKDIRYVRVRIAEVANGPDAGAAEVEIYRDGADLSHRGITRLRRFIERGLSSVHKDEPPTARTEDAAEQGAAE